MKIRPARAEFFLSIGQTDRQTDRHDEAIGCCSQFCEGALEVGALKEWGDVTHTDSYKKITVLTVNPQATNVMYIWSTHS